MSAFEKLKSFVFNRAPETRTWVPGDPTQPPAPGDAATGLPAPPAPAGAVPAAPAPSAAGGQSEPGFVMDDGGLDDADLLEVADTFVLQPMRLPFGKENARQPSEHVLGEKRRSPELLTTPVGSGRRDTVVSSSMTMATVASAVSSPKRIATLAGSASVAISHREPLAESVPHPPQTSYPLPVPVPPQAALATAASAAASGLASISTGTIAGRSYAARAEQAAPTTPQRNAVPGALPGPYTPARSAAPTPARPIAPTTPLCSPAPPAPGAGPVRTPGAALPLAPPPVVPALPSGAGTPVRRIPGPAGALPPLRPDEPLPDDRTALPALPGEAVGAAAGGASTRGASAQAILEASADHFNRGPWRALLAALRLPPPPAMPLQFTISYIQRHGYARKVPFLLALVRSCSQASTGDAQVVLFDPTGVMEATVHRRVLQLHPGLDANAAVVLQKVSVITPLPGVHHLIITPDNIVRVFGADTPLPDPAEPLGMDPMGEAVRAAVAADAPPSPPPAPAPPPLPPPLAPPGPARATDASGWTTRLAAGADRPGGPSAPSPLRASGAVGAAPVSLAPSTPQQQPQQQQQQPQPQQQQQQQQQPPVPPAPQDAVDALLVGIDDEFFA